MRGDIKIKLSVTAPLPILPVSRSAHGFVNCFNFFRRIRLTTRESDQGEKAIPSRSRAFVEALRTSFLWILINPGPWLIVTDLEGFELAPPDKRELIKKAQLLISQGRQIQQNLLDAFGINDSKAALAKFAAANDSVGHKRSSSLFKRFMSEMKQPVFSPASSSSPKLKTKPKSSFAWDVVLDDNTKPAGGSSSSSSAPATPAIAVNVNELPEEVLIFIFLSLPERTRRGSRRVCKLWDAVLRDEALQSALMKAKGLMLEVKLQKERDLVLVAKAVQAMRVLSRAILSAMDWEQEVQSFLAGKVPSQNTELDIQLLRSIVSIAKFAHELQVAKTSLPSDDLIELANFLQLELVTHNFSFPADHPDYSDSEAEKVLWKDYTKRDELKTFASHKPCFVDNALRTHRQPLVDILMALAEKTCVSLKNRTLLGSFEVARAIDFVIGSLACIGTAYVSNTRVPKFLSKPDKLVKLLESYITFINPRTLENAFPYEFLARNLDLFRALHNKTLSVEKGTYV